jgi:hypothetical protein
VTDSTGNARLDNAVVKFVAIVTAATTLTVTTLTVTTR